MVVKFYVCGCAENFADKSSYLSNEQELECHAQNIKGVEELELLVNGFGEVQNYAIIGEPYNRHYFITHKMKDGQNWRLRLESDPVVDLYPLYKELGCIVERQETQADAYINDERYDVTSRTVTATHLFPNSIGDTTSIILTVCGGKGSPL